VGCAPVENFQGRDGGKRAGRAGCRFIFSAGAARGREKNSYCDNRCPGSVLVDDSGLPGDSAFEADGFTNGAESSPLLKQRDKIGHRIRALFTHGSP